MAEYTYAKLRGRIVEKYGTLSNFAGATGKSRVTLSLKMNGKVGLTQEEIAEWAKLLDIPVRDYGKYFFA